MRIGVNLGPTGDWPAMLAAARTADTSGFDALGFLDHYHAPKLEWPYLCGWSLYGALAILTSRIHLVPMVIDRLNYLPGVLAKESSALSFLSNGRFELGIGAGDFFEEASAWGLAVPDAATRITGLKETIMSLRRIWTGEHVNFEGSRFISPMLPAHRLPQALRASLLALAARDGSSAAPSNMQMRSTFILLMKSSILRARRSRHPGEPLHCRCTSGTGLQISLHRWQHGSNWAWNGHFSPSGIHSMPLRAS
jgi:hypothetical protein